MLTFGVVVPIFYLLPEIDYKIVSYGKFSQGYNPQIKKTPYPYLPLSYVTMEGYFDGIKVYKLNDDLANS